MRQMMHAIDASAEAELALIYRPDQIHFPCRSVVVHRTTGIVPRTAHTALHPVVAEDHHVTRPVLPAAGNAVALVLVVHVPADVPAPADRDALLAPGSGLLVFDCGAGTRHLSPVRESE